jgi:hypothetical protein
MDVGIAVAEGEVTVGVGIGASAVEIVGDVGVGSTVGTEAGIVVGGAVGRLVTGETSLGIGSGIGEDAGVAVPSSASFSATPWSFSAVMSRISWPFPPQARVVRRVKITRMLIKICTRLEFSMKVKHPH